MTISRCDRPEFLDRPADIPEDLAANLRDIRFLNQWFGGRALAVSGIRDLAGGRPRLRVLDVATGSADIPLSLLAWGERKGIAISVTGLDISDDVLREARHTIADHDLPLVTADARRLPFPEDSFDLTLCCLALHHFSREDAILVLAEMWRVSRIGIVVTDLTRGYVAYVATWLVTHVLTRNRVTRHDGPLSVLRAYTPAELDTLATAAGIRTAKVQRHPFFRQTLTACKEEAGNAA